MSSFYFYSGNIKGQYRWSDFINNSKASRIEKERERERKTHTDTWILDEADKATSQFTFALIFYVIIIIDHLFKIIFILCEFIVCLGICSCNRPIMLKELQQNCLHIFY